MRDRRTCGVTFLTAFVLMTVMPMSEGAAEGPAPVDLGTAGDFAVLAKAGISITGTGLITGDIGVSPIARGGLTGFSETMDSSNQFSRSIYVVGRLYAADYADPTPAKLSAAVSDMETAYTDAAGRSLPDFTELGAGEISGMELSPGLYKWSTGVHVNNTGVVLKGGASDVWIFQIAADLTLDSDAIVTLSGGARAENIFWQVGGGTGVTLGTTSVLEGTVLAVKAIVMTTGARLNGKAYAQTAVTLDANTVRDPSAVLPALQGLGLGILATLPVCLILYRRKTRKSGWATLLGRRI